MSAGRADLDVQWDWLASATTKPVVISIVDDDRVGLRAMQQMLQRSGLFQGVSIYGSGPEALAALTLEQAHVVLMDIRMPGMSGIECTQRLKSILPEVKILMVTAMVDTDSMTQALRAGADGYLTKPFTFPEGLQAIQLALCGGTPMSKAIIQELELHLEELSVSRRQRSPFEFRLGLNDFETMVINLLAQGKQYKEISLLVPLSDSQVNHVIHRIYRKLRVHNRTEAINRWLDYLRRSPLNRKSAPPSLPP